MQVRACVVQECVMQVRACVVQECVMQVRACVVQVCVYEVQGCVCVWYRRVRVLQVFVCVWCRRVGATVLSGGTSSTRIRTCMLKCIQIRTRVAVGIDANASHISKIRGTPGCLCNLTNTPHAGDLNFWLRCHQQIFAY